MKPIHAAVLLVASCASAPPTYERQPWASVSLEQARAECYAEINRIGSNVPSMYLCMRAKGWDERSH